MKLQNQTNKMMDLLIHDDEQINDENEIQENKDDEESEMNEEMIILLQHEEIDRMENKTDDEKSGNFKEKTLFKSICYLP